MPVKVTDLEKLEELIASYKTENDNKKKHILYLDLVQESLKLVKKIVANMYPIPATTSKDDLIQVGAVGVLKAIDTYDISKRGSFKTYVSKFIKGKILHYLRDKANIVKPPRKTLENLNKVKDAIKQLTTEDNTIPSTEEIAEYTKISKTKVDEILNIELIRNMISLDQNVYSSEGMETLLDRLQAEEDVSFEETYENKKMIDYALSKLSEPDKTVVTGYYINGMSRKELSQKLDVSTTQISRILKRALHKLYTIIESEMREQKV